MAGRRIYYRDKRGRFARTGTRLTAVGRSRSTGRPVKKLISKTGDPSVRRASALSRYGIGEHIRHERTGAPWGSGRSRFSLARLGVGAGTRRRGQTVRKVSRVHRRVRGGAGYISGALGRHGIGTGRRRRAYTVGKVATPRVRRSRARRLPNPGRKTSR